MCILYMLFILFPLRGVVCIIVGVIVGNVYSNVVYHVGYAMRCVLH